MCPADPGTAVGDSMGQTIYSDLIMTIGRKKVKGIRYVGEPSEVAIDRLVKKAKYYSKGQSGATRKGPDHYEYVVQLYSIDRGRYSRESVHEYVRPKAATTQVKRIEERKYSTRKEITHITPNDSATTLCGASVYKKNGDLLQTLSMKQVDGRLNMITCKKCIAAYKKRTGTNKPNHGRTSNNRSIVSF